MWYYIDNGKQTGPVDDGAVQQLIKNGVIKKHTQVWREGMPEWGSAVQSDLVKFLSSTPPPFVPAVTASLSGIQKPYIQKPEGLRTLWLWYTILCSVGYPLMFVYGIGTPFVIAGSVFMWILLYRYWEVIQDGRPRTTPGKAVGYSFIPFYNFYWWFVAFVGLAKDMNAYCRERDIPAKVEEGMALTWFILTLTTMIPFVGIVTGLGALVIGILIHKSFVETTIKIIRSKTQERP